MRPAKVTVSVYTGCVLKFYKSRSKCRQSYVRNVRLQIFDTTERPFGCTARCRTVKAWAVARARGGACEYTRVMS